MILPKKLTEKEIWKSSNDIDKERYLDSSAQKELAELLDQIRWVWIDDRGYTIKAQQLAVANLYDIIKFLRDEK